MWFTIMRQWVRYRPAFQILFISVVAFGMFLGMRPTPPPTAFSWMATGYHLVGLFGCTVLSYLAYPRWRWWARFVLMFAVGISVEWVQSYHPTRSADIHDVYANTMGVACGLALIWLWERFGKWQPRRSASAPSRRG
ncbi:VanZ like family protein [Halopseudomonas xinjiangensis]|uniref:VanZ like family protein n=1 Tax=Halopseudomonas xinjiangensis TaxID=487184 RepID=A0A1H1NIW2_9GAMM|nr:VanZ family protein [Halopseudomonas xinjiangensis]SDR98922.1 VanZ like family protein [Halopseudomonas xinjiangensis]